MTRRTAIFTITGLAMISLVSSTFFKFLRGYIKLDLDYLLSKKELISEIADTIIPRTDSPGAKDAAVQDFIISMITNCTDAKSQYNFIKGINDIEVLTEKMFENDFFKCSTNQRIRILMQLEDSEVSKTTIWSRIRVKLLGNNFLYLMKYYTVMGYCTSKLGATEGLEYDFIPGSFSSCITSTSTKSWATE